MCLIKTMFEILVWQKASSMCLVKIVIEIYVDNKMTKKNI
jgi:hypothetical protein